MNRKDGVYVASYSVGKIDFNNFSRHFSNLHIDERRYCDSLLSNERKLGFLSGRINAKRAIIELIGFKEMSSVLVSSGVFKYPVVRASSVNNIQICISHHKNIGIALAFPEEHPLGVDIERVDMEKINFLLKKMSTSELQCISDCRLEKEVGCFIIWTAKESLSKILRTGLTIDFDILEIIELKRNGCICEGKFKNFSQYRVLSCYKNDFVCSIVLPKNSTADLIDLWLSFDNMTSCQLTT